MRMVPAIYALGVTACGLIVSSCAASVEGSVAVQDTALVGVVTSTVEGTMEGVLVSAKREESTMTVTVVSDASGVYSFPRERLGPGHYSISVRAAGYVLPERKVVIEVAQEGTVHADLRLEQAQLLETAMQMSSAEWLHSYPLPEAEKFATLRDCTRCHTQATNAMSRYTEEQLQYVLQRTRYDSGASHLSFQISANQLANWGRYGGVMGSPASAADMRGAAAVAAINLSRGVWDYELRTFPRPQGKETQVIITTYDLPRVLAKPHDVEMGPDGWVYYNDFNDNVVGKLNPETGETQEWRFPYHGHEGSGTPVGNRTLMGSRRGFGGDGIFYISAQRQRGPVVFNSTTETFELYAFDNPSNSGMPVPYPNPEGWTWFGGASGPLVMRVKFHEDGEFIAERIASDSIGLTAYDIAVDSNGNLFGAGRGSEYIWRIDVESLDVTAYPIPPEPRGGEGSLGGGFRRGLFDSEDRLWWGGFDGGFLGMLDPSKPAGEEMTLYPVPLPWFQPYMAVNDDAGYTWVSSISADRVARFNEETEEWVMYLLPEEANLRHMSVQRSESGGLSTGWVGLNHQAKIVRIEPLAQ